jgi:hypothetical protein
MYEVTKKLRSYEKGTKLRKRYEKGTQLQKSYEGTKMLRNKLRKTLVMKLPSYEIVTPPIGIIYYDVVMHYGEMPRATLGSSDLRSQVAIFGERNIYEKFFC